MQNLYNNLMALCDDDKSPFYFSDQSGRGELYRIFSYHFTDKDSWMLPDALESRGIMFELDRDTLEPLRIAARPMQKFFNKGEVDFIDYGAPEHIMVKADGSLISSFTYANGDISVKSKTSIGSDYAALAEELLYADVELFDFVKWCERDGYTVNMELVAPDPMFRIVLHYDEPKLIVLNARHRETGEYMHLGQMPDNYFTGVVTHDELEAIEEAEKIEGYVVVDEHNNWWKEKCPWYLKRHRAKDFINSPTAFIELVLMDEADDIFTLMGDQPQVLEELQNIQHRVINKANTIVNTVTKYYMANKDLTRKDYAIKAKEELTHYEFTLAMKYYNGIEPNWNNQFLQWTKKLEW